MTIDNFSHIEKLLTFTSEDDYYFVQIIKRRKDNPSMGKGTATIKEYYIDNIDYYNQKKKDIIELCNKYNARATIRLNKRSFKKTAHKMLIDIAQKIEQEQYKAVRNSFASMAGKYADDEDKKWIVDLDDIYALAPNIKGIENVINKSEPLNKKKLIACIPSKTGVHLITRPFDMRQLKTDIPELEIKKDSPTNLYIP